MFSVNEYFDGKVKSIAFTASGQDTTLGVMAAGEYTFGTSKKECMKVVSGEMEVKLPGEDSFTVYSEGQTFDLDANVSFDVKVCGNTSYICTYD